ncbi:MAG: hypothetical protein GF341_05265 [candidate division Zixibacteria bacterium]|nr:hypothetical protein [candidate division Zixibacteria bacterium]
MCKPDQQAGIADTMVNRMPPFYFMVAVAALVALHYVIPVGQIINMP